MITMHVLVVLGVLLFWGGLCGYIGAVIGGIVLKRKNEKAAEAAALARRRVLHDAGRKYPRRANAGPPLRIHKARVASRSVG